MFFSAKKASKLSFEHAVALKNSSAFGRSMLRSGCLR